MGGGQVLPELPGRVRAEPEAGDGDVAGDHVRAPPRVRMGGFDLREPLPRRVQEARLHQAPHARLRRELHEARQQAQADEPREPGEQDRARRGASLTRAV